MTVWIWSETDRPLVTVMHPTVRRLHWSSVYSKKITNSSKSLDSLLLDSLLSWLFAVLRLSLLAKNAPVRLSVRNFSERSRNLNIGLFTSILSTLLNLLFVLLKSSWNLFILLSFKSVLNQYQTGSEYLETVLLQVLVLLITPNSFGKLSTNYYFITVPCLLLHSITRCCVVQQVVAAWPSKRSRSSSQSSYQWRNSSTRRW